MTRLELVRMNVKVAPGFLERLRALAASLGVPYGQLAVTAMGLGLRQLELKVIGEGDEG